ncbi:hypothetical protein QA860_08400 [Streptomyces stelliscabiei]|uniref:hypothetical protein n=1 Tax=Streptomyces stelliscabiei TaxID=146820 RepID=UPI002FF185C1
MTVNVHAILVGPLSVSHTPEQADHAARTVLDQHAHELAELLRQRCACGGMGRCYCPCADLIDPKAQRAATEGDNT